MPVAPLDRVEEVIAYAVSEIASEKILMGIPNYGYVFNVPKIEIFQPLVSVIMKQLRLRKEKMLGLILMKCQ